MLAKSVFARTGERGSKITKSERTYFMDDKYNINASVKQIL